MSKTVMMEVALQQQTNCSRLAGLVYGGSLDFCQVSYTPEEG